MGAQAQPLRFQRDRAAAAERVEHRRRLLGQKGIDLDLRPGRRLALGAGGGTRDLAPGGPDHALVVGALPLHHLLDNAEQPLALILLCRFVGELFGDRGRIVHELREQHRPARGQRAARPPQMQGRGMAVPDRLLPRRSRVDRFQRQGDFDQLPAMDGHENALRRSGLTGSGSWPLAPTRIVGELLRVSDLLISFFRCATRQNDVGVVEVIESRTGSHLPPIGVRLPCRDHCPAVERGAPSGGHRVGDRNGFDRRRRIEPVYRDFGYAWPLQKDVMRDSCASSPSPMSARKYAPAETFLVPDLVRDRHAATLSDHSSSARASRTNPSGSRRVSE